MNEKRLQRNLIAATPVVIIIALGVGCGVAARPSPTVVRVGGVPITEATVNHWANGIRLGSAVGVSLGRSRGTPREKALSFLISSTWLTGEAKARGITVSNDAVKHALRERIESVPGGRKELEEELTSTGETTSDVEFELRAALTAARIRAAVSGAVPNATRLDVTQYYRRNNAQYRIPERRVVDLIESIRSRSAAVALGERLGPGSRFTHLALREEVARQTPEEAAHRDNGGRVRAIFAARFGVVAEPAKFNDAWVLIVARKSIRSTMTPLIAVRDRIAERIDGQRRRVAISNFTKSYTDRWRMRTDCRAGFIVPKCAQYKGARQAEETPF